MRGFILAAVLLIVASAVGFSQESKTGQEPAETNAVDYEARLAELRHREEALVVELDELRAEIEAVERAKKAAEYHRTGVRLRTRVITDTRLFAGPSSELQPLTLIPKGSEVPIFGLETDEKSRAFARVEFGGLEGYILVGLALSREDIVALRKPELDAARAESEKREAAARAERERKEAAAEAERKRKEAERHAALLQKYGQSIGQRIIDRKIWLGMTKEMARESWGDPEDINRTVTAAMVHEQWVYGDTYLYFENGVLTSWQD